MAVLRGIDREIELPDRCIVGRSRGCDLVLTTRDVSSEHAVLNWCGTHWELRDLGSRNGTHIGEQRLAAGTRAPLAAGARLQFGRESPPWVLVDAGGPRAMAVALVGGERCFAEGGYLVLPGADEPMLAVYQESDGGWRLELDGATRTIEDREVVEARGPWRVHLPATTSGTWEAGADLVVAARLRLCFSFSRDEEYIELVAVHDRQSFDLKARSHHYALLLLARARLRHQALPPARQGWIHQHELLEQLRVDRNQLHLDIFRLRRQFGEVGIADAARIVERRSNTSQLRIGVSRIEIEPLSR